VEAAVLRIVVTGSEGFIGKHLWDRLKGQHDLTGIDIKSGNDIRTCDLPDADLVFHLAAETDASSTEAVNDASVNILGSLRIFERYRDKVIFASSSMVHYPVTPYAISKAACEHYAKLYGCSVVRFCNIYGPGGHSVIDKFGQASELTIFGNGLQLREYARVSLAVDYLVHSMTMREPLLVVRGEKRTVLEIANRYPNKPRTQMPAKQFDPMVGVHS
jgi:nucleoside-diphosphate-sugar epimerase